MNIAGLANLLWGLAQNPMFSGLIGASALGSAAYLLRAVPAKLGAWALNVLSYEVAIQNDTLAYDWVERWLARHSYSDSWWCRTLKLVVRPSESIENDDYERVTAPGFGHHLMWHRGWPVLVDRWQAEGTRDLTGKMAEGWRFRICGPRWVMGSIIDEAEAAAKIIPGRIPLYVWQFGWWVKASGLRPRQLSTVYMPDGVMESLLDDAMQFAQSCERYASLGVPYRRGYLFYGEPGTGKTTTAIALATALKRPLYVIQISSVAGDGELAIAAMSVPRDAILLLEDADTLKQTIKRAKKKDADVPGDEEIEAPRSITLGGLLNAIDGVFASEGRILIMTTNHPEKLDPALVRPGRADKRIEFQKADSSMIAAMFRSYYEVDQDADMYDEIPLMSPAHVQNVMLRNPTSPGKAFLELKEIAQ